MNRLITVLLLIVAFLVLPPLGVMTLITIVARDTEPTAPPTPVESYSVAATDSASLLDGLRRAGLAIQPAAGSAPPLFEVVGETIGVEDQVVHLFEYPDEAAAEREARRVSPDGATVGTSKVDWLASPHFYRAGRLIVLYVGGDPVVKAALDGALGPPFAGRG